MIFLVEVWLRQYLLILKSYLLFIWNSSLTGHSKRGNNTALALPTVFTFSPTLLCVFHRGWLSSVSSCQAHDAITLLSFPNLSKSFNSFYVTSRPTPPITLCLSTGIRPIYCPWWRTGAHGGGWGEKVKCIRHLDHPRNLQWTHRQVSLFSKARKKCPRLFLTAYMHSYFRPLFHTSRVNPGTRCV